jgi:hypothetical protein
MKHIISSVLFLRTDFALHIHVDTFIQHYSRENAAFFEKKNVHKLRNAVALDSNSAQHFDVYAATS